MKKRNLLLCFSLLLLAFSSRAQVQKGDLLLGGYFGYNLNNSNNSSNNNSSSNTNFSPRVSVGIGHNSALGLMTSLTYWVTKNDPNSESRTTSLSAGLYWRKYFPLKNKLGWYTTASTQYFHLSSKSKTGSEPFTPGDKINGYTLGVNPGIFYQFSPGVLLNADLGGLSYSHSKSPGGTNVQESKSTTFSLGLFNYFAIGIDFILGKKS